MALDNPLHRIDTFDLNQGLPVIPWFPRSYDGHTERNSRQLRLAKRDDELLNLIQVLKNQAISSVSPLYPFKDNVTLAPSSVEVFDNAGDPLGDLVIDLARLRLTTDFIKDLRIITSAEFSRPYLSKIILREATDPNTLLVVIFIDLEFSARYEFDQQDYVILSLTGRAYNDVQNNENPSSRDNRPFNMDAHPVAGRSFFNSGIVEFSFLGSVQSQLPESWSVGEYQGSIVEGFSSVPNLRRIEFTFQRNATELTQLAYIQLGDLRDAVPFLNKVGTFPFSPNANIGELLAKYILDMQITGPVDQPVYLKRIRRTTVGGDDHYIFLFAYNTYDANGNFTGSFNIGVAHVTPNTNDKVVIHSLGSNAISGTDPDWTDEVITNTKDSFGMGTMIINGYSSIDDLFTELLNLDVSGSPSLSPVGSPVTPPQFVGLFADPDLLLFTEGNTVIDTIVIDAQAIPVTVFERPLATNIHNTRNVQVSIGGTLVNRRITYGNEAIMRDFYGISGVESLIDNERIPLEDEWFDTSNNTLKRYQIVQGRRRWRTI